MRARIAVPGLLSLLMLGGCGTGDAGAGPLSASKVVGPAGGAGGGLSVSIPVGALAADTTIEIGPASSGAPPGYGAAGALYEFKPPGQVFAHPVTVSMPLPAGVSRPTIYWSLQITSSVWDDDGGTARGSSISTGVLHFSSGFVGEATGSGPS